MCGRVPLCDAFINVAIYRLEGQTRNYSGIGKGNKEKGGSLFDLIISENLTRANELQK